MKSKLDYNTSLDVIEDRYRVFWGFSEAIFEYVTIGGCLAVKGISITTLITSKSHLISIFISRNYGRLSNDAVAYLQLESEKVDQFIAIKLMDFNALGKWCFYNPLRQWPILTFSFIAAITE